MFGGIFLALARGSGGCGGSRGRKEETQEAKGEHSGQDEAYWVRSSHRACDGNGRFPSIANVEVDPELTGVKRGETAISAGAASGKSFRGFNRISHE